MLRTSLRQLLEKRLRAALPQTTAVPAARRAVMMKGHPRSHTVDVSAGHKPTVHDLVAPRASCKAGKDRPRTTAMSTRTPVAARADANSDAARLRQMRREASDSAAPSAVHEAGVVGSSRSNNPPSELQESATDEEMLRDDEDEPGLMSAAHSSRRPSRQRSLEQPARGSSKLVERDGDGAAETHASTAVATRPMRDGQESEDEVSDCSTAPHHTAPCDNRAPHNAPSSDVQPFNTAVYRLAASREAAQGTPNALPHGDGSHTSDARPSSAVSAPTETSTSAYRFLLQHIDAEIAALQRRQEAVNARRQRLEERLAHRIRELFELMESPWLLLPSDPPPPLPATAVDVFVKEQQILRRQRQEQQGVPGETADKLFVLACHKNYRSLSAAQKRPYEAAAAHNTTLRRELQRRLSMGSARFEEYCARIRECTAAMVREGHVPTTQVPSLSVLHRRGSPGRRAAADTTSTSRAEGAAMASIGDPTLRRAATSASETDRGRSSSGDDTSEQSGEGEQGDVAAAVVTERVGRRRRRAGRAQQNRTTTATQNSRQASNGHARAARGRPRKLKCGARSASIPLPKFDLLARHKVRDAVGKSAKKPLKSQRAARSKDRSGAGTGSPRRVKSGGRGGTNGSDDDAHTTSHARTRRKGRR